ncbi:PilX N-terminal domain-containing pilus assembly protein [Roseateles sp.]|uniref:PilX N-terminal domain-containing pilus assembly protein n=1 Tax=Roseateles sp. TaxID=1971397 RepID=UPI003BAC5461
MLTPRPHPPLRLRAPQRGLVLVLALIVLAALSLAAVGMMRGVFGSNRVAGNLAAQQAVVQAADVGVERAVAWLEQQTTATQPDANAANPSTAPAVLVNSLYQTIIKSPTNTAPLYSYSATRADPSATQTWQSFWDAQAAIGLANTLAADAQGNQVSFMVHRLCANAGAPDASGCEAAPTVPAAVSNSSKSSALKLRQSSQVYYRITVRVQGPRNATSFIQAIVAI